MTFRPSTIVLLGALLLAALPGCNLIYKQNVQQGNAIEQEDLDELYIGMNQRQVLFVLGTPSIRDPFQPDRWDYVQTYSRRGGEPVKRTVTLLFEDGTLSEIIGQDDPFGRDDSEGAAASGSVASFVKKPSGSPQDASLEEAEEEVLGSEPEIEGLGERRAEDRDVLDQTPKDGGPMGPDIDG